MSGSVYPSNEPLNEAGALPPGGARAGRLRVFARDRAALAGALVLCAMAVAAVLAPWILAHGPETQSSALLAGPGHDHLLGTDELGRDIGTRLLYGTRISLAVAFGAATLGALVGVPIGLVSGYLGGLFDAIPMRFVDLLMAMPTLLVALVVVTVLGSGNLNLILAIGLAAVPEFARLTRACVLTIRDRDFVLASRAMGATKFDTMLRTVLPNSLGPVIVQFVITASLAVVVAAGLSFLGLGPPPPAPSWGGMLRASQSYLYDNPWYGVFPGTALAITVACLDRIGHGLQAALSSNSPLVRTEGVQQ